MTRVPNKKKKRRKYKLVWPSANKNSGTPAKKKRRVKRKVRKEVYYVLAGLVALLCLIFIPKAIESSKLKKLGYKKEAITAIREQKLAKTLIDNQWYSDYLANALVDGTVNTDYLELYVGASDTYPLNDQKFLLCNRLMEKGYEQDQLDLLFSKLSFKEITPLLIYDYQPIETRYIEDVENHRDTNVDGVFELSGNYFTPYKATLHQDSNSDTMLVNKTWYIDESYAPAQITNLSTMYAATGLTLSKDAADALASWGDAGRNVGVTFYAASATRPYDAQETVYNRYVSAYGQAAADAYSARPGFSEHQTGLAVDVAASNEDDKAEFKDTNAFIWASSMCQDYGWILRYPEGKEQITGYIYEPWHYRYVGIDIAKAVVNSGLTYDEFWSLYLKPWDSEETTPSQQILDSATWRFWMPVEETPASN